MKLPKVGIQTAQDSRTAEKLELAENKISQQLYRKNYDDLCLDRQLMADYVLRAKIDKGQIIESKEHPEFGKDVARQIAIDHLAKSADEYPLTHRMIRKAKKGWFGNSTGHSNAKLFGHAGGKQPHSTIFWNKRIALSGLKGKVLVKAIKKAKKEMGAKE